MCDRKWPRRRRKALKVASARQFGDVSSRHGPIKTTSTYLSTVWRADIRNDCQDSEQKTKPWRAYLKILFIIVLLRNPGREQYYLLVHTISSLHVMCDSKWPRRRRKALKFATANEFSVFSPRERPPAPIFHEFFEISNSTPRPWGAQIVCPEFFPRRRGPTKTTSTYLSTIWRADIQNDCQDSEQETKTWRTYPKILFTKFVLRNPNPEQHYLLANTIPSLQFMCDWKRPRRRRKAFKFASATEFGDLFLTWRATSINILWNFRYFEFHTPNLKNTNRVSRNFSGTPRPNQNHQHISLNDLTGGYQNDCQVPEQETKTWRTYPKIMFTKLVAFSALRREGCEALPPINP